MNTKRADNFISATLALLIAAVIVALLSTTPAHTQGPTPVDLLADKYYTFTTSAPGTSPTIHLENAQAEIHRVTWYPNTNPLTTCTVSVDYSTDQGTTWVAGGILSGQPCTSQGGANVGGGQSNSTTIANISAVRINVTAVSGGSVSVSYGGFRFHPFVMESIPAGASSAQPLQSTVHVTRGAGLTYGPPGTYLRASGDGFLMSNQTLSATTTTQFIQGQSDDGATQGCYYTLKSNGGTGTTPTMDVYIQDSADGTNYNDRVHFPQVTTSAASSYAFVTANTAPAAIGTMATRALAASTTVQGPLGANQQLDIVIGGTTPSFTGVYVGMWCN